MNKPSPDIPISIVIAAYNQAPFIAACLESIFNQTHTNHEIIVINDGSTDATADILSGYDGRIKIISQENRGRSAARNRGFMAASHDWIALLDADDLWDPEKLAKQVAALNKYPEIDFIATNTIWFNDQGPIKENFFKTMIRLHRIPARIDGTLKIFDGNIYPVLLEENFIITSSVLMRRDRLSEVGYFDESFPRCEDRDLWLRLAPYYRFAIIDEILTRNRYTEIPGENKSEVSLQSRITLFEKVLADPVGQDKYHRKIAYRQLCKSHYELGYFHFARYDFTRARRELLKSFSRSFHSAPQFFYCFLTFPVSYTHLTLPTN